jgi:hypothetical protein
MRWDEMGMGIGRRMKVGSGQCVIAMRKEDGLITFGFFRCTGKIVAHECTVISLH